VRETQKVLNKEKAKKIRGGKNEQKPTQRGTEGHWESASNPDGKRGFDSEDSHFKKKGWPGKQTGEALYVKKGPTKSSPKP